MSETYVECLVKHKTSFGGVLLKSVMIMFTAALAVLGLLTMSALFLLIAALIGVAAYFVYMRTNLEYEYLYLDKELTVDKVMARTKRKRVEVFEIERMEILAPYHSHQLDSYAHRQMKTVDYSIGEELQPDLRYVMYYNGDKRIVLSPSPQLIKAIKTVAPRKVFTD